MDCESESKSKSKYRLRIGEGRNRRWTVKAKTDISCQWPVARPICNAKPLRKKSQPMYISQERKQKKTYSRMNKRIFFENKGNYVADNY